MNFEIQTVRPKFSEFSFASNLIQDLSASTYFENPDHLGLLFAKYIEYCEKNPLEVETLYGSKGETVDLKKMRLPTIEGFCMYIRAAKSRLIAYRDKPEYESVFEFIDATLYAIGIEGASAGLVNPDIVKRKLGLAERIHVDKVERKIVYFEIPTDNRLIDDVQEEVDEITPPCTD